jgi:hypothetical protein
MEKFDLDKWLIERYSPLTLERIKKAYFDYDDVIEILNEALRQPPVSDSLPTNEEIDLILEQDVPLSEQYQKYSEREKTLMMAATKAGAKWFRSSLIEGNFR